MHALEGRRAVLGPTHHLTVDSVVNLAVVYRECGRYELAEGELLRGCEECATVLGAEHRSTLRVARTLAELYEEWGRPEEAAKYRALLPETEATTTDEEAPE